MKNPYDKHLFGCSKTELWTHLSTKTIFHGLDFASEAVRASHYAFHLLGSDPNKLNIQ
jgi:hypothetical protein